MCTINNCRGKPYVSGGCQVPHGNTICGETKTLDIINEFKKLYEEKMEEIDNTNCGDCLQEKIKLQQDWIGDLTEQNEMLVKAVEELEIEATDRVQMLEDKLKKSTERMVETMKKYRENDVTNILLQEPLQKIFNLENDIKNMLELLRRIREDQQWDVGGLTFYEITEQDLLGSKCEIESMNGNNTEYLNTDTTQGKNIIKDQDSRIRSLEQKAAEMECLAKELETKKEECESLQKNMIDVRLALTEEVATKHDVILKMRRECQELEERCIQADKQTAFKDDIIKELRKEIKQLKQQLIRCLENESSELKSKRCNLEATIDTYEKERVDLIQKVNSAKLTIQTLEVQFNEFLEEKEQLKSKCHSAAKQESCLTEECNKMKSENCSLKTEFNKLRKELKKCCEDKCSLEGTIDELKKHFDVILGTKDECICRIAQLSEENKMISKELEQQNKKNENLVSTVKGLRSQLNVSHKITAEEVTKLNKTIDVLQNTLEKGKVLHEEEERDAITEISCLCKKMKEYETFICKLNKDLHAKNDKVSCLNNQIKEVECGWKKRVKEKENEISNLHKIILDLKTCSSSSEHQIQNKCAEIDTLNITIKEMESCICDFQNQLKNKCAEINSLNITTKEMESCICESRNQIKDKNVEISTLNNTIKEMEICICGLQNQLKTRFEEISTLNNRMKDLEISRCRAKENENVEGLKYRLRELECCLAESQSKSKLCKICRQNIRVTFCGSTEVQTDDQDPSDEQLELLLNRDELIKYQSNMLEKMQQELQQLCETEKELLAQKQNSTNERTMLQNKILLLEGKLNDTQRSNELLSNKDEIIKTQKETVNLLEKEVATLRAKEADMRSENEQSCSCVQQLKNKINELEVQVQVAERRANNLQMAVDLYTNTINVLEASEEKFKLEIDHQRTTITNLQEALVTTKNELDEHKQKFDESIKDQQKVLIEFVQIISDNQKEHKLLKDQINEISEKYEKLQELNFSVEIEHCSSLQDVEGLDNQLFKYQTLLKASEVELKLCKSNFKKMLEQKKCYEEVIQYFKTEMATMAKQLQSLQELLNMSNQTAQEETAKLMQAFLNVQEQNSNLSMQLAAAEQQVKLENQMNQLNEAKIMKLEKIVCEKECNIKECAATIQAIKESLQCSVNQNGELHTSITCLHQTIAEFQATVKKFEEDNHKSKENTSLCQSQITVCREKLQELNSVLEKKSTELSNLESAYSKQHKSLKTCQVELNKYKEKEKLKQLCLKRVIEQLKEQLSKSEHERTCVGDELNAIKTQLNTVKTKFSSKEHEIKRYRKLVGELKLTLAELNQALSKKDFKFQKSCQNEACQAYSENAEHFTNTAEEDMCPCEFEFNMSIIEALKKAITELKKKFFGSQKKNQELEEELRQKELQMTKISKTQIEKDTEYREIKQKLIDTLKCAKDQEERYSELTSKLGNEINTLKQELDVKTKQIFEFERSCRDVSGSKSMRLEVAQEEVTRLREQLNKLLKQHHAINIENDKLQYQTELLQSKVANLEETSHLLKTQTEQYLTELQVVQKEKESLHQKNQDLIYELRSLHTSYDLITSQQRYKDETVKNLEAKLGEVKTSRDEICFESKNTIEYFRHWLQEQNRINKYLVSRERDYCLTIETLRRRIEESHYGGRYPVTSTPRKGPSPPTCQSPCSLGSQGNESIYGGSPSRSPCPCPPLGIDREWFADNYLNESDTDLEDDEDWVSKVENLTEQVKRSNKMWKHKMEKSDFTVTKDKNKK